MTTKILVTDSDLLVVDKPAGMPCLPRAGKMEPTLAAHLAQQFPELAALPDFGLVHRLDNDTSGLVVVARTPGAHRHLRAQFAAGKVEKEYLALVVGTPPERGSCDRPIAHHPRKAKKMLACENPARAQELDARPAHTEFEVLERFPGQHPAALLRVRIATGARHQIRVHLAALGFPLAGDRLYQNPKKRAEDPSGAAHHRLHASRLRFAHPRTGETIEVESRPPEGVAS